MNYTRYLFLGAILIQTANPTYADQIIKVFSVTPDLKDKVGTPLEEFNSGPLITDQGNRATDEQDVTISVNKESQFPLKILDKEISPGQTSNFKLSVNDNSQIKFNIYPVSNGSTGKAKFSVQINKIYSVLDEVWLADHEQAGDWVDLNQRRNYGQWLPAFNRQMANFTQTRSYDEVYNRDIYQIEKEQNSGKERQAGFLRTEDKGVPAQETRNVVANPTNWTNQGGISNCGSWEPNTNTVAKGKTVEQTQTCFQNQQRNWNYFVDDIEVYSHVESNSVAIESKRTVQGTKQRTWHRKQQSATCGHKFDRTTEKVKKRNDLPKEGAVCDTSESYGYSYFVGKRTCKVDQAFCE